MNYREQLESNIKLMNRVLKFYWVSIALVIMAAPLFILAEREEAPTVAEVAEEEV